jgi:cellulose biosynthesis protein BcsQ
MIVLCTHNSGGVGKTTLAIHTTGILQASIYQDHRYIWEY